MNQQELARALNPRQYEAATHVNGPLLVFAGAGSGKTRVITMRAAHLVREHGLRPYRLLCVTFTNKAAGEMRARIGSMLGDDDARDLWVSTFHATGAKLLRRYHEQAGLGRSFVIYDDSDQRAVMNRVFDDLKLDERLLDPRAALTAIDRAKQEALSPEALAERAESPVERRVAQVYANYEHRLRANNAVDFGDLLKRTVDLLEGNDVVRDELQRRFEHVMVDEFQDTNAAQYRMMRALVGPHENLCVVGDDDQAIYRWRGADARNLEYFRRDYPSAKVVKLEQNYRSTGRILRAANAVIERLHGRESKRLFTQNGEGALLELVPARDEREEAMRVAGAVRRAREQGTPANEIAVFYRIHAQSRPLEEAMRAANVPYVVVGGQRFYERAEVKDLLAYLRLLMHPNDDVAFTRVVNVPARGIGKTTLERLAAHATERGSPLWKLVASGDYPGDVGAAARKKLADFYRMISDLRRDVIAGGGGALPSELASRVLHRTGYVEALKSEQSVENEARIENLQELVGSMRDYESEAEAPALDDYLDRVSLAEEAAAREDAKEGKAPRVSLMTVHSAKGLEYDTVFITGLEDGMFPYKGVGPGADNDELNEERRLAYVAITRARRRLVLSCCAFRQIFGTTKVNPPSRFLYELPPDVMSQPVPRRTHSSEGVEWHAGRGGGGGYGGGYGAAGGGAYAARTRGASVQRAGGGGAGPSSEGRTVVYDEDGAGPDASAVDETPRGRSGGMGEGASSEGAQGFRRGMRVHHAKFGAGRVESVEPGAELTLTVYFPGAGTTKRLRAEFLRPL